MTESQLSTTRSRCKKQNENETKKDGFKIRIILKIRLKNGRNILGLL